MGNSIDNRKRRRASKPAPSGNSIGDFAPELKELHKEERQKKEQMEEMWRSLRRFNRNIGHRGF